MIDKLAKIMKRNITAKAIAELSANARITEFYIENDDLYVCIEDGEICDLLLTFGRIMIEEDTKLSEEDLPKLMEILENDGALW